MFTLRIETDGAAFEGGGGLLDDEGARAEVARILHRIADHLERTLDPDGPCMDRNGNQVGQWEMEL